MGARPGCYGTYCTTPIAVTYLTNRSWGKPLIWFGFCFQARLKLVIDCSVGVFLFLWICSPIRFTLQDFMVLHRRPCFGGTDVVTRASAVVTTPNYVV